MDDGDEPPRPGAARRGTGDAPKDDTRREAGGAPRPEDDVRSLAEDWIAIWQSEITAYLTDPETQQAWGAMVALWSDAVQAMACGMAPPQGAGSAPGADDRPRAAGRSAPGKRGSGPQGFGESRPDAAPGSAPAAAAPVAGDDEIRRLEQRIAALERSLAEQDRRRGPLGEDRRSGRGGRPRR